MALLCLVCGAGEPKADLDNGIWGVTLDGFGPGQAKDGKTKRMNCYLVGRDGKWIAGLATPTNSGKPVWNTAFAAHFQIADRRETNALRLTWRRKARSESMSRSCLKSFR